MPASQPASHAKSKASYLTIISSFVRSQPMLFRKKESVRADEKDRKISRLSGQTRCWCKCNGRLAGCNHKYTDNYSTSHWFILKSLTGSVRLCSGLGQSSRPVVQICMLRTLRRAESSLTRIINESTSARPSVWRWSVSRSVNDNTRFQALLTGLTGWPDLER